MPHLILPRSVFVHIPKTSGTWVRKALLEAQVPFRKADLAPHAPYDALEPMVEGRFTFAFVRHPESWYRSFWAYRMMNRDKDWVTPFDPYLSEDFDEFVTRSCTGHPGLMAEILERFTGWPLHLDWVGHGEDSTEGLIHVLTLAGEEFDADAIRACKPTNLSSSEYRARAVYRDETRALLLRAEAEVVARYGYGDGYVERRARADARAVAAEAALAPAGD